MSQNLQVNLVCIGYVKKNIFYVNIIYDKSHNLLSLVMLYCSTLGYIPYGCNSLSVHVCNLHYLLSTLKYFICKVQTRQNIHVIKLIKLK